MCLRFHLHRKVDHSGVSGVSDNIAEGVLFADGSVVIHWNSEHSSTNIYRDLKDLEKIHGHGGDTIVVFDDPLPSSEDDKKKDLDIKH